MAKRHHFARCRCRAREQLLLARRRRKCMLLLRQYRASLRRRAAARLLLPLLRLAGPLLCWLLLWLL